MAKQLETAGPADSASAGRFREGFYPSSKYQFSESLSLFSSFKSNFRQSMKTLDYNEHNLVNSIFQHDGTL